MIKGPEKVVGGKATSGQETRSLWSEDQTEDQQLVVREISTIYSQQHHDQEFEEPQAISALPRSSILFLLEINYSPCSVERGSDV